VKHSSAFLLWLGIAVSMLSTDLAAQPPSARYQYQFPRPDDVDVSRHTAIIVRPGPLLEGASLDAGDIVVTGSISGPHDGRVLLSDDGRTVQFLPSVSFAAGETVEVRIGSGIASRGGAVAADAFTFRVEATPESTFQRVRAESMARRFGSGAPMSSPASVPPPSDVPRITVSTLDDPAPGRVYLANFAFDQTVETTPHLLIVDDHGVPVFSRRLGLPGFDFKRQPDGTLTYFDSDQGVFVVLDSTYTQIGTVYARSGAQTDVHELLMLPNGHALLMGLVPRHTDLSGVVPGGRTNAIVLDMTIEELDTARNPVFIWRSLGHFNVTDAEHEDLTGETVDHVHPNSVAVDSDGDLLISSRHLDEVTKISRTTGEIIWRLGGRNNQFTFTNDPERFSYQHDARRLENGNILLYDNGNHHDVPHSRAVEYRLDETAMTATVVWQYRHTPEVFSYAMGNAQRLPNGNTLIGWGAYPLVTEVRPDGTVAFEMQLPPGVFTYRAFRLPAATSLVRTALAAPPDDSTGLETTVELEWHPTGGATSYQVQVALDSAFGAIVHDAADVTTTSASVGPLDERTGHFWRVRPIGPEISGVWSPTWSFTTEGTAAQQLVAPAQGTTGLTMPPALRWAPYAGAEAYRVQVSLGDIFFNAPTVDTTVEATSHWLDHAESSGRYYWRVRPITSRGEENWSPIWDYRTSPTLLATLPEAITLLSPHNGAGVPEAVQFTWKPSAPEEAITLYRLELDDTAAVTTSAEEYVMSAGGPGVHTWRVRATNANGEQFTSGRWMFTVSGIGSAESREGVALLLRAIAPNPVRDVATLRLASPRRMTVGVRVCDVMGRTVLALPAREMPAGESRIPLDVAALSDGAYLVTISSAEGIATQRLVIAR
jgi:hypothetical protein